MKLLFVSYGGGHIEMCLPVIRAMRQRLPNCDIHLMALTTAGKVAKQAGEEYVGYADYLNGPDAKAAQAWGERLLPGNRHPDVAHHESVAYLGLNFMEWVTELGEAAAFERWQVLGRHAFMPVRFFNRVLQTLQPDVVVSTNSPRSEQAVVTAAAALGVPSLSMVDLFGLPGDPFLSRPVQADRITVLSAGVKSNLVCAGIPNDRIVVTGNPAFDVLSRPETVAQGLAWRDARGWQDRHVVLWAGHREPLDSNPLWAGTALGNAVVQRLLGWLDGHPNAALVVRYHPNEWQDFIRPPAHPLVHWSQPGEESLAPVLMGADQVVVQGTTVGVQAYAAGKRLIGLGFSPMVERSGMDYGALGMGDRADSLDCLDDLLGKGCVTRRPEVSELAGHAAEAVASEIEKMVTARVTSDRGYKGLHDST